MSENQIIEEFVVTARKWRPQRYSDVVGQEHITRTLQNSIKTGRIHHAYLFCGPRGVGKTTTARIHARAVNCANMIDFEPCNECASCKAVLEGKSLDIMEIDGASNNSVDDVRNLKDNAKYPPVMGKYKMYIVDEVHMLSTSAFNALLKILEEPPPHLLFVFATTESHKVPATIISRCQKFDFKRMEIPNIVSQLQYISNRENITIDEQSLVSIAKKGDGSMRDSQSIFDQVIAFCGKNITYTALTDALHLIDEEFFFRISDAAIAKNTAVMFDIVSEVINRGYDIQECLLGLVDHYRNILTLKATGNKKLIESSQDIIDRYYENIKLFTEEDLIRIINHIQTSIRELKISSQPRIKFETTLVQIAKMSTVYEVSYLVSLLKSALASGNLSDEVKKKSPELERLEKQQKIEESAIADIDRLKNSYLATTKFFKHGLKIDQVEELHQSYLDKKIELSAEYLKENWAKASYYLAQNVPGFGNVVNGKIRFFDSELMFVFNTKTIMSLAEDAEEQYKIKLAEFFNGRIILRFELNSEDYDKIHDKIYIDETYNEVNYNSTIDSKAINVMRPLIRQEPDENQKNYHSINIEKSIDLSKDISNNLQKNESSQNLKENHSSLRMQSGNDNFPEKMNVNSNPDLEGKHPVEITLIKKFKAMEIIK